jgi:CO/xanthine dehydrogenase FAD-binding subunit/aerobic-type carbon monoxide dehydrogenase small subunit (CoxS/CutS family)
MKPPPFDYHAPGSIAEALDLMSRYGTDARPLAGGQSLVPLMNFRLSAPAVIVDLNRIPELAYVKQDNGQVCLGAMTRQREIEFSALIASHLPVLAEATRWVGHLPTRTRGTVGGSLAHADPAAEYPAVAAALDAEFVVSGPAGERTLRPADFFRGFMTVALAPQEILVEVRFPVIEPGSGWAFEEFARRHGDFAIVGVAAIVSIESDRCRMARLAACGAGPTAIRLRGAEEILEAADAGDRVIEEAAARAAELVDPSADLHASAEYRRHLTRVMTRRALKLAIERARAGARYTQKRLEVGARKAPSGISRAPQPEKIRMTVNGQMREGTAEPRRLLVDFLREDLGLTGTHIGCEHGICGACTVLLDGEAARSCLMFAAQANGAALMTVEGLARNGRLHPLQEAFWEHHGLQCGFCTPGMLMAAYDFLRVNPDPSEEEIREGLSAVLCRCTGYQGIVRAVAAAAERMRSES